MRKLWTISNHYQQLRARFALAFNLLICSIVALGSLAAMMPVNTAHASANPDNDIVRGGIYGRDLASKCSGDVKTIMDWYWIDCNLAGAVDGRACRDGNVYVGDRVVARNATSIGRMEIQGSHPISIGGQTYYETPNSAAFLSDCIDAFVLLDQNGSFKYAILKPCGNPIYTPSPVVNNPPTPPTVSYMYACDLATKRIRYVTTTDANDSSRYSKNLADCTQPAQPVMIQVCVLSTKATLQIKQNEFNASLYSTNLDDCKQQAQQIQVCNLTTKSTDTIDEKAFDSTKYSTNLSDCSSPCQYNTSLPATSPECVAPSLPHTGITDNLAMGGFGIGSLLVAGSAYVRSRKDLLYKLLHR
jgi:LPXTG-motif cell wall-anchored protein